MSEMSIGAALAWLAARDPHRPAITCEGRTVTRAELDRRTNRLARAYAELGVGQDHLVTIALGNSIEAYEAYLAVWKLGATPQPVSARLPARERDAIVELADPPIVVGVDPGTHGDRPCVPVGFEPDPGLDDGPLPDRVAAALKAPTSGGSTGRPKIIVAGQPALIDPERPRGLGARLDGTQLVPGPLYHNAPFVFSTMALLTGNHLVVMTRFDAATALELVERHRVDWMLLVPTMMHRIWRLPTEERLARDVSSLNGVLHLGAPCPPWLKHAWIEWLGPERVWELYAGTEAQGVTIISGEEWLAHPGSVGRPAEGTMEIRDLDGTPLPPGEVGEVWMHTPADRPPTYRYVGAEAKRVGEWESLGDLGSMDADGYLYLSDRLADMILTGGANVYPAEVEAALDEHPAVVSCAVVGLPDDDLGNRVHAVVHLRSPADDAELRAHLAERLAGYKIPRTFERVDGPVRDDAGKVRRSALRDDRTT
ncbi:MAG TPA: AMP-binding protein [Acidimicrobiales bacterium]|nr:AMP-binding protein [Acidimicrobiales bacterium]